MKEFFIRLIGMLACVAFVGLAGQLLIKFMDFLFTITNNSVGMSWAISMGVVVLSINILWSVYDWFRKRGDK